MADSAEQNPCLVIPRQRLVTSLRSPFEEHYVALLCVCAIRGRPLVDLACETRHDPQSECMAQLVADLKGRLHTREVGGQAVWSVTSAKAGNGVELLRDDRDDTYWQSDGAQPHLVSINFSKKVLVNFSIYVLYP